MKLNSKKVLNSYEELFDEKCKELHKEVEKSTNNPSGSFPLVGKRTGNLNRSVILTKISNPNQLLGVLVNYAKIVLTQKGGRLRHLIDSNGLFYSFWKSLFK